MFETDPNAIIQTMASELESGNGNIMEGELDNDMRL